MSGASHLEVRPVGQGGRYSVFNAAGDRISGILGRDYAYAFAAAELRRDRLKLRACLKCGAEFASEGAHNRMCDPCRSIGQSAGGFDDCHSTAGKAFGG